jgi:hypothetical protein
MQNKIAKFMGLAKQAPEAELRKATEDIRETLEEANKAANATRTAQCHFLPSPYG